ncbi:hypothetical protein MNBD_GAMMA11-913 [hydrothermal vent metagenome]|uniref:Lipoprotein n=1 Tax=hydrothermal vent metagenome TaxID=652676 RepID=A0A3B0Y2J8_9ZZZZ
MKATLVKNTYLIFICTLFMSCAGNANIEEVPLATPEALQQWCKSKTIKYFKDKSKAIHNWSALWKRQAKLLDVKASVVSENINYTVKCRVQQGESSKKAIISISAASDDTE